MICTKLWSVWIYSNNHSFKQLKLTLHLATKTLHLLLISLTLCWQSIQSKEWRCVDFMQRNSHRPRLGMDSPTSYNRSTKGVPLSGARSRVSLSVIKNQADINIKGFMTEFLWHFKMVDCIKVLLLQSYKTYLVTWKSPLSASSCNICLNRQLKVSELVNIWSFKL